MDLKIIKEDSEKIVLLIKGETHTFLQLLKKYSLDKGAEYSAYYKEHPLNEDVYFYVKGKNARKILEDALDSIYEEFLKLEEDIENLDIN